jgi:hypothetical protein
VVDLWQREPVRIGAPAEPPLLDGARGPFLVLLFLVLLGTLVGGRGWSHGPHLGGVGVSARETRTRTTVGEADADSGVHVDSGAAAVPTQMQSLRSFSVS